jgi:alkyl hydroperoxide reductase subunit AhpC
MAPPEAKLLEFQALDAEVLRISVDSAHCHEAWAKSLEGITYPLLSDMHRAVIKHYGILNDEFNAGSPGDLHLKQLSPRGEFPDPENLLAVV